MACNERIGEFWSYPQSRAFGELLIDCEEDRTLRAMLVGILPGGRQATMGNIKPAQRGEPTVPEVGRNPRRRKEGN